MVNPGIVGLCYAKENIQPCGDHVLGERAQSAKTNIAARRRYEGFSAPGPTSKMQIVIKRGAASRLGWVGTSGPGWRRFFAHPDKHRGLADLAYGTAKYNRKVMSNEGLLSWLLPPDS